METGKRNTKDMIVMGIIGLIVGAFFALFASVSVSDNYSTVTFWIILLVFVGSFGFWGSKMKDTKELEQALPQEGLTRRERVIAWIFALLNPIITGAVMYYMWKKSYPVKAKQANQISMISFLIWIGVYILRQSL